MPAASPDRYARVREIYDHALRLPSAERAAFLAEQCAGEDAIRAEVEDLLHASESGGEVVRRSMRALEVVADGILDDGLTGTVFAGYRLIRRVGRGGMGTVYEAVRDDPDAPARVAVKLLHQSLDHDAGRERFRRERRILAGLEHPGIARFLDGGVHEGRSYVVLEFVEGSAIDAYCDEAALPLARRLELMGEVCAAVQYAHGKLVVHRDIKPANVLVTPDARVKLLDFGIARLLEDDAQPELTLTGAVAMTPEYASPEQIRGEIVSTASDVYQLGALLFRVLAGAPAFALPNRAPASLARILEKSPPRPSEVAARNGGGAILEQGRAAASELEDIVLTALRREPERRYSSAEQLRADIERFLSGRPILARPDTLGYRSRKFASRHRTALAATASSALALMGGVGGVLWQARRASREAARARIEREKADRVAAFLQDTLSAGDPRREGREARIVDALDRAAGRIDEELAGQPDVAASLHGTLSRTYLELGLYEQAESTARNALAIRRGQGRTGRELSRAQLDLGLALVRKSDYREAEPFMKEALRRLREAGADARLDLAEALNCYGILLAQTGRLRQAERAYREALKIYDEELDDPDDRPAGTINNLAVVYGDSGDVRRAEKLHRRALAIIRQVYGEEHADVAYTLYNLAGILDIQGRYREAEEIYRQVIAMRMRLLGDDHPLTIQARTSLASVLSMDGRPEEGIDEARGALAVAERALPADHLFAAYANVVLGRALLDSGRPEEAEVHVRAGLRARRAALGADHWSVANAESLLGEAVARQGRRREARRLLEGAYRKLLQTRGPRHDLTVEARDRLAAFERRARRI